MINFSRYAVIGLITAASVPAVNDWPQWRGPDRNGSAAGVPAQWPEKLKQQWKVTVGEGHSSPIVVGNRVYQFARRGENEVAYAFDLDTGKKLWEQSYAAPYTMNPAATGHGKGPKSTPVAADGRIFTFGINGALSALDAAAGKVVWRQDFKTSPHFGAAMSPVVDGGMLIAHVGGHDNGTLTAFDASTGKPKWQWKGDGPAYASPVIGTFGGVKQVITQTQNNLVGLNAGSGAVLWKAAITTPYDQNSVTPFVHGDLVISSGLANPVTAYRVSAASAVKVWENKEVGMYMSSPALLGGNLLGLSHRNKGQFFLLNPGSGKIVWTGEGRQAENAAIIVSRDLAIVLTTNSELLIMRPNGSQMQELRRYTVAQSPTWASPAIVHNRILIKDFDSLALWSTR